MQGGQGNDRLDGGDGMDFIDGGQGSDYILGGIGDDFILGGGNLTVNVTDGTGPQDYNHFADGAVDMLTRDPNGVVWLPAVTGVSPTNAFGYEQGWSNVEGVDWVLAYFTKVGVGGTATNGSMWRATA